MLYLDQPAEKFDESGIAIDLFLSLDEIPNRVGRYTEPMHQHSYYELFLIFSGACQHIYRDSETTLMRGDIVLIPPHMPHEYRFQETISLASLQFYPEQMDAEWETLLHSMDYRTLQCRAQGARGVQLLRRLENEENERRTAQYVAQLNRQGIVRLGSAEHTRVEECMRLLEAEQREQEYGYARVKRSLLEQIMVTVKRVQIRQFDCWEKTPSWKEEMVEQVLEYIDRQMTEEIDFARFADAQHITQTYFRRVFKEVTGLPPVEYLNRTRVLRALELLQTTDITVAEAAARVGIYDANYFSRVFKKYLGYAPRYFKHLENPR